jgi:hypothetical protein
MNIIYRTGIISLIIQAFIWIFDIYVLTLKTNPSLFFVRDLLWIEFWVQIIEGIFYIWLVTNFSNITNITPFRYYDWVITTPTMLFTYSMYLYYINTKDTRSFYKIIESNTPTLVPIFILNTLMLLCGYLSEIGKISIQLGTLLGFIPFFMFFYLIYDNYAKYTSVGKWTFVYFSGIWGLYGLASLMSYKNKNTFYNILDLFSKNFFGIFLAIVLLYNKYL